MEPQYLRSQAEILLLIAHAAHVKRTNANNKWKMRKCENALNAAVH